MLYTYIVLDNERTIQSVHGSIEGAAVFAFSWGEPRLPDGSEYSTKAVEKILKAQPSLRISYDNGTYLDIECHGIFG